VCISIALSTLKCRKSWPFGSFLETTWRRLSGNKLQATAVPQQRRRDGLECISSKRRTTSASVGAACRSLMLSPDADRCRIFNNASCNLSGPRDSKKRVENWPGISDAVTRKTRRVAAQFFDPRRSATDGESDIVRQLGQCDTEL